MRNLILVLTLASSLEASATMENQFILKSNQVQSNDYLSETYQHSDIVSVEVSDVTREYEDKIRLEKAASERQMRFMGVNGVAHLAAVAVAVDQVEHIVDKVINIGQKIWTVVEKAQGVQNVSLTKATALPQGAKNWNELENWKQPVSRVIRVAYKNLFNDVVVRFDYRIILLAGGSSNGVGKYIGYAAVKVEDAHALPFYTFNAKVSVDSVYNKGTKQDPLAGMILVVDWTVSSFGKSSRSSHTYYLDGAGRIDNANTTELP